MNVLLRWFYVGIVSSNMVVFLNIKNYFLYCFDPSKRRGYLGCVMFRSVYAGLMCSIEMVSFVQSCTRSYIHVKGKRAKYLTNLF